MLRWGLNVVGRAWGGGGLQMASQDLAQLVCSCCSWCVKAPLTRPHIWLSMRVGLQLIDFELGEVLDCKQKIPVIFRCI